MKKKGRGELLPRTNIYPEQAARHSPTACLFSDFVAANTYIVSAGSLCSCVSWNCARIISSNASLASLQKTEYIGNPFSAVYSYGSGSRPCFMKKYFSKILKESGKVTITEEKVQKLLTDIMQGFEKYVKDQGIGDISADQYGTYFRQYLQTAEAKQIITDWVNDLYKDVDIEISEADLQAMAQELAAGYLSYAQEKGYADVTKMGENFAAYLGTADGKQRLSNGLSETLDMKSLESQLSSGMNAYMKQAMRAYAKSFGNALETQISSAMEQIIGQMSSGMG